jgi:hypothetical protein
MLDSEKYEYVTRLFNELGRNEPGRWARRATFKSEILSVFEDTKVQCPYSELFEDNTVPKSQRNLQTYINVDAFEMRKQ